MRRAHLAATAALSITAAFSATHAQAADLTLCWAAWDPANALVELSKDFEAQSGHTMNFEFVPWPNFADRMLNELNSGGKLCDLLRRRLRLDLVDGHGEAGARDCACGQQ